MTFSQAANSSGEWKDAQETMLARPHEAKKKERDLVLEDPELTPKPLRIRKRGDFGLPAITAARENPNVGERRKSHTQHALATHPCSSSLGNNHTELDLTKRSSDQPTSPWTRRHTFLNVRKPRDVSPSAPEPMQVIGISVPYSDMSAEHLVNKTPTPQNGTDEGADFSSTRSPRHLISAQAYGRHLHEVAMSRSSQPKQAKASKRVNISKHMTPIDEDYRQVEPDNDPGFVPRRRASFKNRLLSKMKTGLTSRPSIASDLLRQSRADQEQVSGLQTSDLSIQESSARKSSSGSGTESSEEVDIDEALAAFPTPPSSTVTSPTTLTANESTLTSPTIVGSNESFATSIPTPVSSQAIDTDHCISYRTLSLPKQVPTIGAEVSVHTGSCSGNPANELSLLVEIDAVAGEMEVGEDAQFESNALDVAFLIDNS